MSTVEDLRAARALVERGWCQNAPAQDAVGHRTGPKCDNARAWCAEGAISAVTQTCKEAARCVQVIVSVVGVSFIPLWNDYPGRTKAQVLAAFDRAIAAEESKNA